MKNARIAAVLTWVYAAAFGPPAIPVTAYLLQNGKLPTFLGLLGFPWVVLRVLRCRCPGEAATG